MSSIKNYLHQLLEVDLDDLRKPINAFSLDDLSSDDWDLILLSVHRSLEYSQKEKLLGATSQYKDLLERLVIARIKAHSQKNQ